MGDDFYEVAWRNGGEAQRMNQNTPWLVPRRYQNVRPLGQGGYGMVCKADDLHNGTGKEVAIKKLYRPFDHPQASVAHIYSQRAYRELRMLKFMKQHPHINVIGLVDAFTPSETIDNFRDIYLVTPLVDADLSSLIRNDLQRHPQRDTVIHYIAYQILCGLKHIHSADIIHRYACKKQKQIKLKKQLKETVVII